MIKTSGRRKARGSRSTADLGWTPAFGLDEHQRILFWSEAAETRLGISAAEALGRPCYEVMHGRDFFGRSYCRERCPAITALLDGHLKGHCAVMAGWRGSEARRLRWNLVALPPGSRPRVLAFVGQESDGLARLVQFSSMSSALSAPIQVEALSGILGWVAELTEMEVAELFLLDEQTHHMVLASQHGPSSGAFRQITEFAPPYGYPGIIAATAEPLVTDDLCRDSRYLRGKVKELGFREYVCVPLLGPEGVLGALNVASRRRRGALPSVLERLQGLSRPLSASISTTILRARDSLADFRPEPTQDAQGNMEGMLKQVLGKMLALSGAWSGTLALRDRNTGILTCRVTEGQEDCLPLCPLTLDRPLKCPAWAERRNVLLAGHHKGWPEACRTLSAKKGPVVCLPLMADNAVLGVASLRYHTLMAISPTGYLGVLSAVAHRAAMLVNSLQVYGRALDLAVSAERQRLLESIGSASGPRSLHRLDSEESGPVGGEQAALEIRCFGDFRVSREGQLLPPQAFGRRQAWIALKILMVNLGRKVPKDLLIETLWPGIEPGKGIRRLHVVIHALRQTLEPGKRTGWRFVLTDGDDYSWNTNALCRIDIQDFRSAIRRGENLERHGQPTEALAVYQAAIPLYRGDFMQDESYSDWCWTEREFFRELYLSLVKRVARLLQARGDLESAALYYLQGLQVDPLREEMQRDLVATLWEAGHRGQALRQYLAFSQRLKKELGVDPLPETQELYEKMNGRTAVGARSYVPRWPGLVARP